GRISQHLTAGGVYGRFFVFDSLGRLKKSEDSVTGGHPPTGCPDLITGSLFCHGSLTWSVVANTTRVDTFDVVGNRTTNGGAYNTGNRITTANACTYATNAAGSDSLRT